MKYECGMIRDLLPLYHDRVCSKESAAAVEAHLQECGQCSRLAEQLNNNRYEKELQKEKQDIVGRYAKKLKRNTAVAGAALAGVLVIPVLVCLICNLAVGRSLDWFFIVFASLLVFASLSVVPLVVPEKRGLCTLAAFTVSLLLLLLVCSLYTGGRWFFVAAVSCLLGLSVCFMPYVLLQLCGSGKNGEKRGLSRHIALLSLTADTFLLFALLFCVGLFTGDERVMRFGFLLAAVFGTLPWLLLVVIRYTRMNGFFKAALCTAVGTVYFIFANDIVAYVIYGSAQCALLHADFSGWTRDQLTFNGNMAVIYLAVGLSACVFLTVAGILKKKGSM